MKGFITIKGSNGNSYELKSNRAVSVVWDVVNAQWVVYNGFKKVLTTTDKDLALDTARSI